ncbi:MAG: sigma-70 family RNA polymerase sigma factor [Planctomycetota bacterium]|nr:sigma-70 family RNA polymerase sigma factor [Planctomycetota bacterium]
MGRYATPAMRQLAQRSIRDLSRVDRLRQLDRAERIAADIQLSEQYPYRDLCRQIAADNCDAPSDVMLTGDAALHDLRLFIEDVSASAVVDAENIPEPVWTLRDVSERFNVSTKTVDRWREKGLISRRFRFGNRTRIGFLDSSVRRFLRDHTEEVERGRRFSQLTDRERDEIVEGGRRLVRHGLCPTDVARLLAEQFERSHETVRYTLQQHDLKHPERAVFPTATASLSTEQKQEIYQKFRRGVSIERLSKQFGRTGATIYRIVGQVRAEKLLAQPVDFMDSPEFHKRGAEKKILGEPPEVNRKSTTMRPPAGLPPYLASLYTIPLLTREQEQYWFRKMNYLKYRAADLQKKIDPKRPKQVDLDSFERLVGEATEIKNFLIRSNLRLVVSIAKKYIKPTNNFFEMVSDGNMSLIRAIEKFDYTKGNKFSTYATWAIMKNFARSIPAEHKRLDRFRTGKVEVFQHSTEGRGSQFEEELTNRQQNRMLMEVLEQLDPRERDIVMFRYGLGEGNEPLTLEQVGTRFGVTKERIRQLESRALRKLRKIAEEEKLDIPGME